MFFVSSAGNFSLETEGSGSAELALHWPTAAPRGSEWDCSLAFQIFGESFFFSISAKLIVKIFEFSFLLIFVSLVNVLLIDIVSYVKICTRFW